MENGGPTGDNSNYIGIDTFSYHGPCGFRKPDTDHRQPTATDTDDHADAVTDNRTIATATPSATCDAIGYVRLHGSTTPSPTLAPSPTPTANARQSDTRCPGH